MLPERFRQKGSGRDKAMVSLVGVHVILNIQEVWVQYLRKVKL